MGHADAMFLRNGVPDQHKYLFEAAALPNPLNAQLHNLLYENYPTEAMNTISKIQIETTGANNQQLRRVFCESPKTLFTAPVQTPAVLQRPAGISPENKHGFCLPDAHLDLPRQPATRQAASGDLAGAGVGLWGVTQEWDSVMLKFGQAASDPHWARAASRNGPPQGSITAALSEGGLPLPVAGSSAQFFWKGPGPAAPSWTLLTYCHHLRRSWACSWTCLRHRVKAAA